MNRVLLADLVVTIHLAFVVAVLLAQLLILVGWILHWAWVRNFWFRLAHLVAILIVAGQAVLDIECPLTTYERHLRGGDLHDMTNASAIGRFCNETLFFDSTDENGEPRSIFMISYVSFAALVVLTWCFAPPRLPWRRPPPVVEPAHSSLSR
jgi:hypothetical protein